MKVDSQILGFILMADAAIRPALSYALVQLLMTGEYSQDPAIDPVVDSLIKPRLALLQKRSESGKIGGEKRGQQILLKAKPKAKPKALLKALTKAELEAEPKAEPKAMLTNLPKAQEEKKESNKERIEEYNIKNTHTNVCVQKRPDGHTPTHNPNYQKFLDWLDINAPLCKGHLVIPTEEEFIKLKDKHTTNDICAKILELENKPKLIKNYKSLYLTLLSWFRRDNEN